MNSTLSWELGSVAPLSRPWKCGCLRSQCSQNVLSCLTASLCTPLHTPLYVCTTQHTALLWSIINHATYPDCSHSVSSVQSVLCLCIFLGIWIQTWYRSDINITDICIDVSLDSSLFTYNNAAAVYLNIRLGDAARIKKNIYIFFFLWTCSRVHANQGKLYLRRMSNMTCSAYYAEICAAGEKKVADQTSQRTVFVHKSTSFFAFDFFGNVTEGEQSCDCNQLICLLWYVRYLLANVSRLHMLL